jgi:hypothetical protein
VSSTGSGLLVCCAVWSCVLCAKVSEENTASIFRAKVKTLYCLELERIFRPGAIHVQSHWMGRRDSCGVNKTENISGHQKERIRQEREKASLLRCRTASRRQSKNEIPFLRKKTNDRYWYGRVARKGVQNRRRPDTGRSHCSSDVQPSITAINSENSRLFRVLLWASRDPHHSSADRMSIGANIRTFL